MKRIMLLLLLLSAAFAAEVTESADHCQQAAQLADANNKYLRQMQEEGFLTVNGMDTLLSGQSNRTSQALQNTAQLCTGSAERIDSEFTWLKIEWIAQGIALLVAVYLIWERKARSCFGIIKPTGDRNTLLVNGTLMTRVNPLDKKPEKPEKPDVTESRPKTSIWIGVVVLAMALILAGVILFG